MKKTLLSVLFCCLFVFAFADNVITVQEAKTVSKNFITAVSPTTPISESDLILKQTARGENDEPLYYVFGIRNGGFIVVSASDASTPVLAYSLENDFRADVANYMLDCYKADIAAAKAANNTQCVKEWEFLRNYTPTRIDTTIYIDSEVKPLLTSTWNQVTYYNNYCPFQADAVQNQINLDCDGHVPAGCVATDMSVIMHYYRYPEYGIGGVGYHPIHYVTNANNEITDTITYPWQVQNFNVKHDYNYMPNSIDAYTGEVAKLMWHAGISVQMDYGPDGSGAQSPYALTVMKNNWGYERTAQIYNRGDYSNIRWCDSVTKEIDQLRPIYYSGSNSGGGHAFMFDGYQMRKMILTTPVYGDTIYTLDHVDSTENLVISVIDSTWNDVDSVWVYAYDTAHNFVYDTVWNISHTESLTTYIHDTIDYHTLNTLPLVHINWGWGGYNNGYYTLSGTNHVGTYTQNEAMMIGLYPADQAPKDTTGHVNVYGTRGSISDGAGNLHYRPNTDRTWMIAAPGATRYSIKFLRLETENNADEVIFYKNGNMNDEAGRYSGNTCPSTAFNIVADSVLVRFVSNGNEVTGRGFVFDFTATTPSGYCDEEVILPAGTGIITDKGNASVEEGTPYRPETTCTWRINGFDRLFISYPQIELGAGDFIDFFDVTQPAKQYPIYRIDNYNWPNDDVLIIDGNVHKLKIRFVSDNFEENNGFTLTYETVTNINENNGLNNIAVYPNPASSSLNVDLSSDYDGQINFRVTDMTGRTLSIESIHADGGELHHTLNVSNLSKGLYLLSIEGTHGKSVRKFVVE